MKPDEKVLKETRLRNLKRRYSKVVQHADFAEEAIELKAEIDGIELQLILAVMRLLVV